MSENQGLNFESNQHKIVKIDLIPIKNHYLKSILR